MSIFISICITLVLRLFWKIDFSIFEEIRSIKIGSDNYLEKIRSFVYKGQQLDMKGGNQRWESSFDIYYKT